MIKIKKLNNDKKPIEKNRRGEPVIN